MPRSYGGSAKATSYASGVERRRRSGARRRDARAIASPAPSELDVRAGSRARLGGAISTKSARRGAARQRLEAERAGAGEQVEHARVGEARLDDAHPRLAHAVARSGARGRPAGAAMRPPAPAPGDDAHALRRRGSRPSLRLQPRHALVLVALEAVRDVDGARRRRARRCGAPMPQPIASSAPSSVVQTRSLRPSCADDARRRGEPHAARDEHRAPDCRCRTARSGAAAPRSRR